MSHKKIIGLSKLKSVQDESEIKNSLFNLLDHMQKLDKIKIPPNAKVLIKPNICLVKSYETGATVNPLVVKFLVDWLNANYDIESIIIAEADATLLNIKIAFKALGWNDTFCDYPNVKLLNLTSDNYVAVGINGLYFDKLEMSQDYMDADFLISVAKLKTHTMTGISCTLKNQFGANPVKYKAQYHNHLDEVISDLNMVKPPDLCLIDGIIAMEGEGPIEGIAKPMGLLILGDNAVATDHACAYLMGLNPNKIRHLNLALSQDIGNFDYEVFGEDVDMVKTNFLTISKKKKFITSLYNSNFINKLPLWKKIIGKF